jgi:gliding motility-associated-like protein
MYLMKNKSNFNLIPLLLFVFSTVNFVVKAQDDCATATDVIDLTGTLCAVSTVGTTSTIGAASCEEGLIDTWFHFTAQGSYADITVTASTAGFRPEFVVFESDDNTCTGIFSYWASNCFDLTGNYTSISGTAYEFIPGNEYWIVVSSNNETTSGTIDVCVNNPVNPVNDLCTNATTLVLDGTCVAGTTENATDNITGVDGCQDGAVADHPEVFYTFVADQSSITFDVTAGTMTGDVELTIWGGDCTTPFTHSYACGPMPLSQSIPGFTVGNTYWVSVSTNGNEGTFNICPTSFTPVATPGQDCPTAQLLCDPSSFTVGTINAGGGAITGPGSDEDLVATCFGSDERQAQWYQFSVNTSGDLEFQVAPNTWSDDYDWAVFDITATGCVINGNVPIACNWSGCNGMTGITSNVAAYSGGTTSAFDYYYGNPIGPGDCLGAPGGADNGAGASQWENAVNLVAGNSYVILIDNYSTTSNDGYAFTWTGTDAGIGVLADFSITGGGCTDFNVTAADIINSLNSDTYTWDWGDGSPVLAGPSTNSHDYTAAGPGTYTIEVTVTDDVGCTKSYFLPVSVGTTLAADAGIDQTICSGTSTDIGGSPAATGGNGVYTYAWTPADATVSNATVANPTITTLVNATYTLTVTDGLGCTATDDMNIIIDPLPTATAGGTETICSSGTATVSGATSSNGTILWTEDGAGSITAGATTLTPTYTAAAGDEGNTVTLTMTVTSTNSCAPQTATATYTVIVEAQPTATAGGTETICSSGTATVSGATATNGTIAWTEDGAGSITAGATTLTPTYTAAAGDEGNTVTLTMTVTSTNSCAPQTATATYTVIVEAQPTATAGGTETICSSGTATVSGATATNGTIAWTEDGAGSITAGATTLTPTYTAAAGDEGNTVTLTMTVTSTNSCAPQTATATYTVIVEAQPTATAGGSETICSSETATVSGATATNGTIAWTEDGAGSITAGATTLTPTYTAAAGDEGNTVTLTMIVTSTNSCAPQTATATYTVIVDASPSFTLGSNPPLTCNGSDGELLISGLNASDNYNVTYYDDNAFLFVGPTAYISDAGGVITIGGLDSGPYSNFTVELVSSGCSTNDPSTESIANPGTPDINDNPNQTVCGDYTLPAITGTLLTGNEGYYLASGGIGVKYNPGQIIPGNPTVVYIYDNNGICFDEEVFTITYDSPPTATAGGSETICSTGTATVSGATATNGTILWTEDGAGSITAGATTLTPTYTAAAGDEGNTVTLTMTVTSSNTCGGTATASYTVIVEALPTATAGGTETICSTGTATVSGATATDGTIAWTEDGAGSITAGATTLTPTYTAAAGDEGNTVTLTMTVTSSNTCAPQTATATYTVIVEALPTATAGGTETICSTGTATVSGATATNGTILWTEDGAGSITAGATTLTPTYTAAAGDEGNTVTLTMTVTSTNACAPQTATATYTVIVEPLPTATAGGSQSICSSGTATVSGATSANGTILWTEDGAGSITAGATTLTPTYTAAAGDQGNTVTLTMTVTSTNSCAPQTTTATYSVIVNNPPSFSLSYTSPTTCNGTEGTITFTGLTPSTVYNVSFDDNGSTTGVTLMNSDASGMITVTGLDAGDYDNFWIENTVTGCSSTDPTVLTLPNPGAPIINDIADQTVCDSYTLPTITGTGLTGNQSYWTGPSATGTQLAEGTLVINSQTIYIYDLNGSCPDEESFSVVVNVTPTITNNTNSSLCSGESFDLTITSDVSGATFDWTSMPLGTNVSGNSVSGTGNISEVLTNNGSIEENVMYTIIPTGIAPTFCVGASMNYIVTVHPNSDATFQSASYCEETTNLVLIAGDTGGTFSFEPVPTDGATIDPSSGSILNGIGGTDYVIKYVVGTTCPDSSTLLISTYAMPDEPYVSGQGTYCHNEETVPLNAFGGNGTFTWYSDAALQNQIATGTVLSPTTDFGENVYYVTETQNTCEGPATTALVLIESCTIDIPTAFTPDNNGVDDDWDLENIDAYFPNNQVRVYNRWGALIYESDKGSYEARPWNGTYNDEPLPVASYYFIVEFNDNETNPETGTVSIIKK